MRSQYVERTPEIENAILERLAKGEPLNQICSGEGMPRPRTVRYWVSEDEAFAKAYQEARDDGFDAIAASCLEIADDGTNDYMEGKDGPVFNAEHVQRSKLRIWTRFELLKKWDPKRYGDLIGIEHSAKGSIADLLELARGRILAAGRTMPEASK